MILPFNLTDVRVGFLLSLLVFVGIAFALLYSAKVSVNIPPIGRVNWRDAVTVLVGLVVTPAILTVVPTFYLAAWIGLSFVAGVYTLLSPVVRYRLLAFGLAIGLTLGQFQLRSIWLNDFLVILAVSIAAVFFVQGGIRLREVTYMAAGYSIFDVFAIRILQPILFRIFSGIALVPMLLMPYGGVTLSVGGGDLLLVTVFTLILKKEYGIMRAIALLATELSIIFAASLLVGIVSVVPLSPLLTLPFAVMSLGRKPATVKST